MKYSKLNAKTQILRSPVGPGRGLLVLVVMLSASAPIPADPPPPGLAEVNVLPKYEMWIPDAALSELRPDVVTPHTPWARPYAGRGLKIVVIAPRWTQRATVELQQRFAFDAVPVMTFFHHTWADTDGPHYGWIKYGTKSFTTERALAGLRSAYPPDVIVIGWLAGSTIPEEVESAILDAVAAGSGLVIINPRPVSDRLKALIQQYKPVPNDTLHSVVDPIPTRYLPPLAASSPRRLLGEGAKFYEVQGRGRIAVLDYAPLPQTRSSNCYLSPPGATESGKGIRDIHYDYYCSLAGRIILWAGRNLPQVRLTGWGELASRIDMPGKGGLLGTLKVVAGSLPSNASLELVVRDLDSRIEHRSSPPLSKDGRITLEVPALREGHHYADLVLRDGAGRTLDWGTSHFTSSSGARVAGLTTEKKSYRPDDPMPLKIVLEGDVAAAKLAVQVFDLHDRLVWMQELDGDDLEGKTIALRADLSGVRTVQCRVHAMLQQGDIEVSRRMLPVSIVQPQPSPKEFQYGAWASTNASFVRRQTAMILADHGVRTGILGGDMDDWAGFNVMAGPYISRHISLNDHGETGLIVRKPCLTDPAFREQERMKLREKTEVFKHYSPVAYSLGDDQGMMREPLDGCVSPTCLASFRKYLAGQYGTIEALNTSWDTGYTSFEEALPLSLPDALSSGQYSRWVDHRLYMDQLFVEIHRESRELIRSIDPGARVGFEGPLADNSWIGFEWKQLLDVVDQMAPYPNAWKWDIVRSFAKPNLLFGGWHGAYPMYRYPDDRRFYPWYMLFQGANIYYYFSTYGWSEAGDQSIGIAPDLRTLPNLDEATANVNRIQQGIDRLVLGAVRVTDDVAIFFSRPSQHAAMISPPIPIRDFDISAGWSAYMATHDHNWSLNTEAMLRLLDDMGLSYVFVDHTEVAAGALKQRGFKMLVMPFAHALSASEAEAIRQFAEAGGTVLADVKPAAFDLHAKPLEQGHLDDLFGIRRDGPPTEALLDQMVTLADLADHEVTEEDTEEVQRDAWFVPVDEILQFSSRGDRENDMGARVPMPVDATVVLAGGAAAVTSDAGVPVFVGNTHGRGQVCLMNMAIQHYLTLRAAGRGLGMQFRVAEFLARADITPDIRARAVGGHPARLRLFRFRDGDAELVGLLRPHKRLHDEPEAFADRSPRPFVIDFSREGHLYNVIDRRYLGRMRELELTVPVATPFLFALLPYRVEKIDAKIRCEGHVVNVDFAVHATEGPAGRHVVNVRVTDASGRRRTEYDRGIVAVAGQGTHGFTLALNDPIGSWVIDLEDVASGMQQRVALQVPGP